MVRFLIVVTGYNCEQYVKQCFDSIKAQTYNNYSVVAVDDGSSDNTWNKIQPFGYKYCFNINRLTRNIGTYYARDSAITGYPFNYSVIVLLDMDDRLLPHALETVAREYEKNPNLLMTYGNYTNQYGPFKDIEYPDETHANRSYRQDKFRCTHLRTFRKELYDAIPKWNLTKSEVQSYPDAEILFSMMEMAGKDRMKAIHEPIYWYEPYNPIRTLDRFGKDEAGYIEITQRPKRELI